MPRLTYYLLSFLLIRKKWYYSNKFVILTVLKKSIKIVKKLVLAKKI